MSVRFSAAAISNAARYTNGLNTDPGWRRAETARLNCDWLYERPPTSASTSPVRGSTAIKAACARPLPVLLGEQGVDRHQSVGERVLRQALQVRVERREHLDPIGALGEPRKLLAQRLADHVDEVGGLCVERPSHHLDGLGAGARGGVGGNELLLGHRAQDDVAPLPAPRGRGKRRPVVGRLNHAGDGGRLAQREVHDVFPEEQPRGFGDAVHGKRAALPEVHLVEIELEDLLLRRLPLEDERHVLLGEFAPERLLGCEEEVLDQLLRDRAAAHQVGPIAAHVGDDGADRADDVDARMVVEAAVLDGQDRLDHPRRNHRQRDTPALLAACADERREQRRVQRDPRHRRVVDLEARDAQHGRDGCARRRLGRRLLEVHAHQAALGRAVSRRQHDGAAADGKLAGFVDPRALRVAQIVEAIDELVVAQRLAPVQLERARVDAGQHAIALAVQARVDLPPEDHPPVAEHADGGHAAEQRHHAERNPELARDAENQSSQPPPPALRRRGSPGGHGSRS